MAREGDGSLSLSKIVGFVGVKWSVRGDYKQVQLSVGGQGVSGDLNAQMGARGVGRGPAA